MRTAAAFILFSTFLISCGGKGDDVDESQVVAEAYGNHLTHSDLDRQIPDDISVEDSTYLAERVIDQWVRRQAMLNKANDELSDEEKDLQFRLKQYEEDLLIYALQRKLIAERLSTEVSDAEIENYYETNKKNFELKENIVRLIFFKLPSDEKNIDKLWRQFQKGDASDINEIMALSIEKELNFHRDEDLWLKFSDIVKEIPITTYNQENYLNNHKLIRLEEGNYTYFVKILDFRIKNSISPLEFERERIRSIIINKRKVEMLKQIEDQIVREAYDQNKIK